MQPLLTYALNTTPSPLEVDQQNAILTLVATNATANSVTLEGITITIPVGDSDSATALTNNPSSILQTSPTPWTTNTPNPSTGKMTFIFVPIGGKGTTYNIPANESLVFALTSIQVNAKPGTITLTVTENNSATQPITLSKYPAGWGNVNFSVEPISINAGGEVKLTWNGPSGATYSIQYQDNNSTVNIPAQGESPLGWNGTYPGDNQPPLILDQSTVFTLTVSETIEGNNYQVNAQQTFTVNLPDPEIISFTGEIDYSQTPPVLNLTWQTTGADYVSGSWTANTLDASLDNPLVIQSPFSQSYTIKAINPNITSSSSKTIELVWNLVSNNIAVGDSPTGLAVSPDNQSVFVANMLSSTLSVIDVNTYAVIQTISAGFLPFAVAVSPNGTDVFVASSGNGNGNIITLDASTLSVVQTINVIGLKAMALSPDGSSLFMINDGSAITVLNASTFSLIKIITAISLPQCITMSPDGNYVFVANESAGSGNTVSVIDMQTLSVIQTIAIGFLSLGMAVSPDSRYVFVANIQGTTISVIEVSSFSVIQTIQVGKNPTRVAVSPTGECFVTNQGDNTVSVIEMSSLSVIQTIPVGIVPSAIAVSPDGKFVFVANNHGNTISVLGLQVQS